MKEFIEYKGMHIHILFLNTKVDICNFIQSASRVEKYLIVNKCNLNAKVYQYNIFTIDHFFKKNLDRFLFLFELDESYTISEMFKDIKSLFKKSENIRFIPIDPYSEKLKDVEKKLKSINKQINGQLSISL